MCGIAGYYDRCGINRKALLRMSESLAHRGPDDEGFLLFTRDGMSCPLSGPGTAPGVLAAERIEQACLEFPAILGWAHRRLAILDLSPAGHQPMQAGDGVALMLNGEIYNHEELRRQLQSRGYMFHSRTDTEVALHAYREWGTGCFTLFRGMWAMAIYDAPRCELILSRDRFAIKPLYYHQHEGHLSFASEIKALLEVPGLRAGADDRHVYQYLAFPTLQDPCSTLFSGIRELEPGHSLHLSLKDGAHTLAPFYSLGQAVETLALPEDEGALLERYREALDDSIRLHLRSDVPVGSCLSGGLDSSAIVSLAAPQSEDGFHTFTARYGEHPADESRWAALVNGYFPNVSGHDAWPAGDRLWEDFRKLIWHQDLPIHSTSMYAQWEVMKVAGKQGMKVLLDGQGADEVLGGSTTMPALYLLELLLSFRLGEFRARSQELKAHRELRTAPALASAAFHRLPSWMKRRLRKQARLGTGFLSAELRKTYAGETMPDFLGRGLHEVSMNSMRFGLHDLLRYEDRNSMAFSIESRVPFLDHPLVELGLAPPPPPQLRHGYSKYALRRAVEHRLPPEITWRTDKKGFITPQRQWHTTTRPQLLEYLHSIEWPHLFDREVVLKAVHSDPGQGTPSNEVWKMLSVLVWKEVFNVRC